MIELSRQPPVDQAVQAHICRLLNRTAGLRMPELFVRERIAALYHLQDRHGVGAIAVRTTSLTRAQLTQIMTYRLAQYVLGGTVDANEVYERRLDHEPLSSASPGDIHVIAGSPETGQIFSYAVLRSVPIGSETVTLAMRSRPLFPVEDTFGWGIFNSFPMLSHLPVSRVLELSRFVKNHQIENNDERAVRSPIEVCVALHHVLCGSLRQTITAVVGDVAERVAKRNLEFFHVPTVVIRDVHPLSTGDLTLYRVLGLQRFLPFAFLIADLAEQETRLTAIEEALWQPAEQAIRALIALKRTSYSPRSGLDRTSQADVHSLSGDAGRSATDLDRLGP